MTPTSPDGKGEARGILTLERDPLKTEAAAGTAARVPVLATSGTLAAVVVAMVAAAVYQQGGFYPTDAFGLAVVSVILVIAVLRRSRDLAAVRVTASVGALTVWWFLRSIAAHRAVAFFPFGAALLGFLAGFLVIRSLGDRDRTRVVMALVAIASATGLLGLTGVLWHITSWAQNAGGYWQLATPLTQPEAAAALVAVTLLVGLALDLDHWLVRVALCVMLATFVATQSHWTLLALAAGALCMPRRRWLSAWWPLVMGVASSAAVIASASGHLSPWAAAVLLVTCGAAACWHCEQRVDARMRTKRGVVVVALLALAFVAAGTTLLVLRPPGVAAPRQPADQSQTVAWSGAAHAWRSSTLTGVAPPTIYASNQPVDAYPGVTPDTDITVVAQGGLIGAVLLALVVAAVAAVRGRRTTAAACALGATIAFVVVGVVDVAWQLPALAIVGGCVAGLWARPAAPSVMQPEGGTAASVPAPPRRRAFVAPALWTFALCLLLLAQLTVGINHGTSGGLARVASAAPPPSSTPLAPARTILRGPDVTDPFMLSWQGQDIIYTSEGTSLLNVPARVGAPGHWGPVTDALPRLPQWAMGGATWAPDVHQVAGGWALYFTSLLRGAPLSTHCIGAAFSSSPTGPFSATDRPFICELDHRGSIDARVFDDGGHLVMLWKSDDNADPEIPGPDQNGETGIYAQSLAPDGRTLLGQPVKILGPSQQWEGTIIEAPDMVEAWGTYWLFFSGNWYYSSSYGIGVAACQTPFGPCADVNPKPLIGSNFQGSGPGEESVYVAGGDVWLLYNPFKANDPGPVIPRPAVMTRLGFTPQGPYLATP
jgi:Glycosyl hydrolases family 43